MSYLFLFFDEYKINIMFSTVLRGGRTGMTVYFSSIVKALIFKLSICILNNNLIPIMHTGVCSETIYSIKSPFIYSYYRSRNDNNRIFDAIEFNCFKSTFSNCFQSIRQSKRR